MTNQQAVAEAAKLLSALVAALESNRSDEEIHELLGGPLVEWTLIPELEELSEIVAKSWLEARPKSALAREHLRQHLIGLGKPAAEAKIALGANPTPIGVLDGRGEHIKKRFLQTGQALRRRRK